MRIKNLNLSFLLFTSERRRKTDRSNSTGLYHVKTSFLVKFMFLFLLAVFAIFPTVKAGVYVNTNLSSGGGGVSWIDAYNNLQTALDAASSGDTVYVAIDTITLSGDITINKTLTVVGGYNPDVGGQTGFTTIDGNNVTGCFSLTSSTGALTMSIDHFIFKNGYESGSSGAAIGCLNVSPVIKNCIFVDNIARHYGGAIIVQTNNTNTNRSDAQIINCLFYSNDANNGGAVACLNTEGGTTCTMTNCTFYGNASNYGSNGGYGGAVYAESSVTADKTQVNLYNNAFYNNTDGAGGYLDVYYDASSAAITAANNATDYPAGLLNGTNGIVDLSSATGIFVSTSSIAGSDGEYGTTDDGLVPASISSALYNAGSNSYNTLNTDITGDSRILYSIVDIGAYEAKVTQSIGGYTPGIWLRGENTNTATDNANVTTWYNDGSGNDFSRMSKTFFNTTINSYPTLKNNTFNFNPSVSFNSAYMNTSVGIAADAGGTVSKVVFAVISTNNMCDTKLCK